MNTKHTPAFSAALVEWEELVTREVEEQGDCCTSDAQGIIEAKPALLAELFKAGTAPAVAAAAILGDAEPIAEQTEEEFFAYRYTPEGLAATAATAVLDAQAEAKTRAFFALHFGIDMTLPGADEKLTQACDEYNANCADMDDTGN